MRARTAGLTVQELEIMKIVWERERATVRDVYETLLARRKIAYTTVMTVMNILEDKGFLKKRAVERAYVYQAARPRAQVVRAMLKDFVNRVYDGSAEPLLVQLVKDRHLSKDDIEKIARGIEEA
ncbi:MAG: BlaI/MecI/CopY family transcriptional regulator [Terriglobia bacterium]